MGARHAKHNRGLRIYLCVQAQGRISTDARRGLPVGLGEVACARSKKGRRSDFNRFPSHRKRITDPYRHAVIPFTAPLEDPDDVGPKGRAYT